MIAEPDETTAKQRKLPRGKHPNSLKNLKKFKRGVSGNPAGPPTQKMHLWRHIQNYAAMDPKQLRGLDLEGLSMAQLTARGYVLAMTKGDWQRIKEALDRDDGRPSEHVEVDQETRIVIERI